jgi:hypothetical protein
MVRSLSAKAKPLPEINRGGLVAGLLLPDGMIFRDF